MVPDTQLRRVSVYADDVHVDLALPAGLPIAALLPPIGDILVAEYGRRDEPVATRYQLSLPGGTALDTSRTLAQQGIRDGAALILSRSSTELPVPCFDDAADAVSTSLAAVARPWTRRATRLTGALAAIWLAGVGALTLVRTVFVTTDVRHVGAVVGVVAAAGCSALLAATIAHRGFRDGLAGLTLGLLATGFVGLAGLLAVPGGPGAPNALLAAMAAAVTAVVTIRVTDCGVVTFRAIVCFAIVAAVVALVGAATAVPLHALGAMSAVISLALLEVSARVSIVLAGLSPRLTLEPAEEPASARDDLPARAIRADAWLTSLVAAFATSAALGAIGAAVGASGTGGPRVGGVAFATLTGAVLLARTRSQSGVPRILVFAVAGTATLSVTLVVAATTCAAHIVWIAAATAIIPTGALCLGFIVPAVRFSPVAQRSVELLACLVLAILVPLACWICGLYGAARELNLP